MGFIFHRAVVVTGWDDKLKMAHEAALKTFKNTCVSNIVGSVSNGYASFFIAPDGSKEVWETSSEYDDMAQAFARLMTTEPCGPYCDWIFILYGEGEPYIEASNGTGSLFDEGRLW